MDKLFKVIEEDNRFKCGRCRTQMRKPVRYCKSCEAETLRFNTALKIVGGLGDFYRFRGMISQKYLSDPHASDADSTAVVLADGLKCSVCGEHLYAPTEQCPSCCRKFALHDLAMEQIWALPSDQRPSDTTILKYMAGSGTMEPSEAGRDITHKKLLTGIPDDMMTQITAVSRASGISANEWIRTAIKEKLS